MIYDPLYIVITLVALVASNAVGAMLRRRFAEHSQEALPYSGEDVARKMLADNGIDDVEVISVVPRGIDCSIIFLKCRFEKPSKPDLANTL